MIYRTIVKAGKRAMFPFEITDTIAADLARFEELRTRLDAGAFLARTWSGRLRRELESECRHRRGRV